MTLLLNIFLVLELDKKAQLDLMLLAQSGLPGKCCCFNELLWRLLSRWAVDPTYQDLSHKVSSEVNWIRRTFDRPPRGHRDLWWGRWSAYDVPGNAKWSPLTAPTGAYTVRTGPGGLPLEPPDCWGTPTQ